MRYHLARCDVSKNYSLGNGHVKIWERRVTNAVIDTLIVRVKNDRVFIPNLFRIYPR